MPKIRNAHLPGSRYGHLTVIEPVTTTTHRCRCTCGEMVVRDNRYLRYTKDPFCGKVERHPSTTAWVLLRPTKHGAALYRCETCGSVTEHDAPLPKKQEVIKCYCSKVPYDPMTDGRLGHHYARSALRTRANLRPFLMDEDCRAAAYGQNPEVLAQLMKTYEFKATPIAPDPEKPFGINNFAWTLDIDEME